MPRWGGSRRGPPDPFFLLEQEFPEQMDEALSPWLAKFLIRNGTRFLLLHRIVIIPVHDLENLVWNRSCVYVTLKNYHSQKFFDSPAQHYVNRPLKLEDVSCRDFYIKYNIVYKNKGWEKHGFGFAGEETDMKKISVFSTIKRRELYKKINLW